MKSASGFTIVELLIVIVVIAILAAISIIAYNGVQERTRNSVTISGTREYIKALKMFATDNGEYPAGGNACLGDGYLYNGNVNRCGGNASIYVNSSFDAQMSEYLGGSKPKLDTTNIWIRDTDVRAGAYYSPTSGSYGIVYYILSGKTGTCEAGGNKVLSTDSGVTGFYCAYSLPRP